MNRLLALVGVAAIAFTVVSAAAAAFGTSLTSGSLSANHVTIKGCSTAGTIELKYDITSNGTVFVVTAATLTAKSGSFTVSPSCVGAKARVNFAAQQVYNATLTTGDFTVSGTVLTLDVTDTNVEDATNFAILLE